LSSAIDTVVEFESFFECVTVGSSLLLFCSCLVSVNDVGADVDVDAYAEVGDSSGVVNADAAAAADADADACDSCDSWSALAFAKSNLAKPRKCSVDNTVAEDMVGVQTFGTTSVWWSRRRAAMILYINEEKSRAGMCSEGDAAET
jgi:hypothetical protein